jgi:hypothetical protein
MREHFKSYVMESQKKTHDKVMGTALSTGGEKAGSAGSIVLFSSVPVK